jgi:hypothetical protein
MKSTKSTRPRNLCLLTAFLSHSFSFSSSSSRSHSYDYATRWGRYNMFFHNILVKILQSNNYFYNRSPAFRSMGELEIISFGQPSADWPLRTLLSFYDRTPNALTAGPTTSSCILTVYWWTKDFCTSSLSPVIRF